MIPRIHAAAGVTGFLCILTFWSSTVASELFGSHDTITAVKHSVLWGMLLLVPSMAVAGGTGLSCWAAAAMCWPWPRSVA